MQDVIHDAILANGRGRGLNRVAEIIKAVGLDQRSIGIGDLIGLAVEQIEHIELDPPAVFKPIADAAVEDAGRR